MLAEIVVALEAKVRPFDPEQLFVLRGNGVVDFLHIGRLGQEVIVDLGDERGNGYGLV